MKYFIILLTLLLVFSCNKSNKEESQNSDTTKAKTAKADTSNTLSGETISTEGKDVIQHQIVINNDLAPLKIYVFPDEGKIKLTKGNIVIQTFPVTDEVNFENEYYRDPSNFISTEDFNFDGYKDLMFLSSSGTGGRWYDIYLYDKSSEKFVMHDELSKLTSPSTDSVNQIVRMYDIGGMAGAWYNSIQYKWKENKLVIIRQEWQESENVDSEIFTRTIEILGPDNKMKVASSVRIEKTEDEKEKQTLLEGDWTEFDKTERLLFVESQDDVIRIDNRNTEN